MVHIHAEGPAFFAWLPKMFGKRVVVTVHGIDWQREKWQSGLGSKFIHQGEKNAAKYADEVIVLSKGVQDYFKETYGRETHFIPNGVNRPQIREASLITDKFGLKKDSYILFLGRLVPEKGIRYLVEAFKNVKTDKKLVIAGGSSDTDSFMEELKELAKGDDRILFTGFVQGAMLDELYSNAYIYTLPSDLEGMPLSLLEAMSYGNCCLVSDIPECAEVVEDTICGLLFMILSIVVYTAEISGSAISFAMGLLACVAVILIVAGFEEKFGRGMDFLAKYTMPIFLLHTLFAAPLRSILMKIGIENAVIHVVLGLVISFAGPIIAAWILKKTKWLEFFLYPNKFIRKVS